MIIALHIIRVQVCIVRQIDVLLPIVNVLSAIGRQCLYVWLRVRPLLELLGAVVILAGVVLVLTIALVIAMVIVLLMVGILVTIAVTDWSSVRVRSVGSSVASIVVAIVCVTSILVLAIIVVHITTDKTDCDLN